MSGGNWRSGALHYQQSVKTAHKVDYPLVVLVNQLIHITLDLVGVVIIFNSYSLSFELRFLSSILHNGDNELHVFGTVIRLVVYL